MWPVIHNQHLHAKLELAQTCLLLVLRTAATDCSAPIDKKSLNMRALLHLDSELGFTAQLQLADHESLHVVTGTALLNRYLSSLQLLHAISKHGLVQRLLAWTEPPKRTR